MDTERGKAAFEHYEKQIREMDRETLEEFAINAAMETMYEHGGNVEIGAFWYYYSLKRPITWTLTDPVIASSPTPT